MAKSNIYHELAILCNSHEYPIYIGVDLLSDKELLRRHVAASQVLIVTNETLAPLYLERVKQAFESLQCDVVVLADGEQYKNQKSLFEIYDALLSASHHRDTTLVALGGGVIGDITGFAAATYQRGVPFIQLPTTLLAQVDASVGGKTAINHPLGKNMIGCFHQPHAVIMDLTTLQSLPPREMRAGFAEVIKYGLLVGGDFLSDLQALLQNESSSFSTQQLAFLIARCCEIKGHIVHEDEKEKGKRALLNLGHTFAHALESYTSYTRWLHGEAVGIGLYCATLLSYQLGYLEEKYVKLVDDLLSVAKLPRRIPQEIDLLALQAIMLQDKKVKNNVLHLVLLRAPGECYLDTTVSKESLHRVLLAASEEINHE